MSKGNEPAYPHGDHGCHLGGLTKREYFAGLAMQGWLANSDMLAAVYDHNATEQQFLSIVAKAAGEAADAVLDRLEKTA